MGVNILVDTATIEIKNSYRLVIRDANDFVYVFVNGNTGFNGNIRAYKATTAGEPTAFTEQDAGNAPDIPTKRSSLSIAIDSTGLVHLMYNDDQTGRSSPPTSVRYSTFRTSAHATTQDEWAIIDEQIDVPVDDNFEDHNSIAIDANDDPHVIWSEFISSAPTLHYNNKIGGTWSSGQTVHSVSSSFRFLGCDLIIGDPLSAVGADRPIIAVSNDVGGGGNPGEIRVMYGDALDPSSFTEEIDVTGTIDVHGSFAGGGAFGQHLSMAIDSNDKITIAFVELTTQDLMVVEHLHADAWTTWQTPVDVDTSTDYEFPSIAIDGTDRLMIVKDDTTKNLRLWGATNGTWSETSTTGTIGTFDHPIFKWANYNNNNPDQFDYVWEDATGLLYNTFPQAPAPLITMKREIVLKDSNKNINSTSTEDKVIIA